METADQSNNDVRSVVGPTLAYRQNLPAAIQQITNQVAINISSRIGFEQLINENDENTNETTNQDAEQNRRPSDVSLKNNFNNF
jgi:hypothetical protein